MRGSWLHLIAGSLSLLIIAAIAGAQNDKPQAATASVPEFVKHVRPLLATYCFSCHGPLKRRGGLNLEKFDDDAEALDQVDLWDRVREHSLTIFLVITGIGWALLYWRMNPDAKWGQVVGNLVSEWTQILGLGVRTKRLIERGSKESRK